MRRQKTLFPLPDYRGPLGAAPWSELVVTPDLQKSLKNAALPGCPCCTGMGFTSKEGKHHPCHCLNRRDQISK